MIRDEITSHPDAHPGAGSHTSSWLDRSPGELVRVNWEILAWTGLILLAVVSRFYGIGWRVMSHDESLHAVYSYDLYLKGSYQHNPMMHGPFLFHMNALIYALFGASDATSRIMPALAGIATVAMAWPFRRWIGRTAALLAGLLLLVSPSLLFHSRYIRNDIYIALFAMVWVYGMFRYLEERRGNWLYVMVVAMALGFATKENQFMTGAIFGAFVVGMALWQYWQDGIDLKRSPFADIAVLMLTLVLPFISPLLYLGGQTALGWSAIEWNGYTPNSSEIIRFAVLVGLVTGVSGTIAYLWYGMAKEDEETVSRLDFETWSGLMLTFWVIEIIFFTTFFTNPLNGLATGIVGSLGYWIAQQEVARGGQPWYYYFLQTSIYEFLPFLLSVGGITALVGMAFRSKGQLDADSSAFHRERTSDSSVSKERSNIIFALFLLWWTVGAWIAYSYAGEKMPWLMVHLAQPMALLGAWWLGGMIDRVDWAGFREARAYWLVFLAPVLLFALTTVVTAEPFGGRDLQSLEQTIRFILGLVVLLGLVYAVWVYLERTNWSTALRAITLGMTAILLLLTVRFSYMLTYVNYDMATEYLVYAHGGPDVKRAIDEIELISERTAGDNLIQVAYDDETAWPMSWYMRFFPNSRYYGANPNNDAMASPVVMVGDQNYNKVEPYLARDYVYRTYRLVWWPEESYKSLAPGDIWAALTNPEQRSRLWQIWFFRNHPGRSLADWPHRDEFRMYVRSDLAEIVWDLNVTPTEYEGGTQAFDYPELDRSAIAVYGGSYDGLAVTQPRAVAVGPAGNRYIVDTGNHRVVVLEQDGSFIRTIGSACFLSELASDTTGSSSAGQSNCTDLDGSGPLEPGDGQFREPWGVAVDEDGRIYVSDTWNGRIQVFDAEGDFLTKWGAFNIIEGDDTDPYKLFGPRGIDIAPNGDLLVADTGNKRVLRFTPEGEYVAQIGGGGRILGRFEEPVDVDVDPGSGRVFVADLWNQRIQVLSPALEPLEEWAVPTWESQDIYDKAYLAVGNDGTVYVSDPQYAQIFIYEPRPDEGPSLAGSFGRYGAGMNQFTKPTGLGFDRVNEQLLVADADNNRVMVFEAEGAIGD